MQPANISILCLMLFCSAQLFSAYPVYSDMWTNDDMNVLQVLLQRLEESIPESREVMPEMSENVRFEGKTSSTKENNGRPQEKMHLHAEAKEFLSAKDLKSVRSDNPSKKYSGCFGRRMDRIGSMSTLGCNTVG
ncbi:hypothetical protein AAFF_G00146810 [Aldrovandia affinis]|uniref:B-type natriuretic peptide n=1 Tax=Aldrovandia affinis TaxID=143900 RepID=A0AAD7W949_9TELE|nr:hypothetical protein AAFF_G00146810 [Aldrovandia affinis]